MVSPHATVILHLQKSLLTPNKVWRGKVWDERELSDEQAPFSAELVATAYSVSSWSGLYHADSSEFVVPYPKNVAHVCRRYFNGEIFQEHSFPWNLYTGTSLPITYQTLIIPENITTSGMRWGYSKKIQAIIIIIKWPPKTLSQVFVFSPDFALMQ